MIQYKYMVKELVGMVILKKLIGDKRSRRWNNRIKRYIPRIAALMFFSAALVHTLRVSLGWSMSVNGWELPYWTSVVLVILTSYLAYNLWRITPHV